MKKNDYLLLAATASYSFLFYRQTAGINFLLFTLVFITLLVLKNVKLLRSKAWLWSAVLSLVSGAMVFVHSSDLSILANILSLLLLSGLSVNVASSSLFSFIFGCYSVISSLIYIILDAVSRWQSSPDTERQKGRSGLKLLATLIVTLLSLLFFQMYRSSNPLFAENTRWINFDFISAAWIFFTLGGFLLTYGLLYSRRIEVVDRWESGLPFRNATVAANAGDHRDETERYAGMLLFVVLNLMLVVLNAGDIQTLYLRRGLPPEISHADFVHNGVGILILSILIATSLILYLSRREFEGIRYNRWLQGGIYLWLLQNLVMLSSTAVRNQIYIQEYNFTYRRIGVYVWLFLAMCGLCILFWKILKKRSNWYLVKTNVALWFTVLVCAACFNWDKMITRYNLANKPLVNVDIHYLFNLSEANIPELLAVTQAPDFATLNARMSANMPQSGNRYYSGSYIDLLRAKVYLYLAHYTPGWRSFDLRNREILGTLHCDH